LRPHLYYCLKVRSNSCMLRLGGLWQQLIFWLHQSILHHAFRFVLIAIHSILEFVKVSQFLLAIFAVLVIINYCMQAKCTGPKKLEKPGNWLKYALNSAGPI